MQAWGTIGTYEAREEPNPIPQDSSPLNDACNESGLVATVIHHGPNAGVYWVYFTFYDGNGNVMGYVRGADGLLVAQYEYGPFGELLRATGPLSQTFNYLFSTKYLDWETGLLYYGHRYYSPTPGRWLSTDPFEEEGGINLHGFAGNNPINSFDSFGLDVLEYWSEGRYYTDGRVGGYKHQGDSSGMRKTSAAWYWQRAIAMNCSGGLCNSGGKDDSSSFVEAKVKD